MIVILLQRSSNLSTLRCEILYVLLFYGLLQRGHRSLGPDCVHNLKTIVFVCLSCVTIALH